ITDLNGKLLAANQRAADMLGYAFDEVQHLSLSEISAETEKTKEVTRRLLAGEKIPLYERLFCKKDGTIFPVEINVDLVMDENGNPMHIQSVVRDITRRKQTEEALRQSEESYHGLFNSVTEAIYIQDEQGRFLDVNQGAVKMYGYPRDYFIGRTPEDLAAPDRNDMAVTAEKVRRAFAGEMQQFEFWGRRSNGEIFPKEVSVNRGLYFGKPVVIAAARDITERKRAEEKLRESEARNRAILNTIPDLMFLQDRVDGRFLDYHAPDLNSLLGPPEQFLGHAMAEVLPPELTDRFIAAADNAVSSRQTQTFEFSAPASDSMRTFESRITMMDEQRVITIVRDITERKQAEDKLRFQESRFRSLIENSHDGIALVDLSGVASFISPTLPRILGHQEKDLLNIFRADFVHPEDLPQIEMAAGHWLQEGAPGPLLLVYRYLHTDGSWCWLETVATNLLADPAVGAIVLNFHDITQRKLAEDVLRETKDQLAAILATLADGVSVTDSSGKLIYVNAAIARSAGYSSPQEMLESYHTQISTLDYGMVDETGKPFPLDQLPSRLVAQGKSAQPTVIGYRTPDHQPIRWVIMKAGPILDDQGKVKLVVTVTSDITERKRAEETLRRNRDLLLTLNHAAQAVQRARTPDQVYRAVGEELKALGYDLMIFTLTDDCRHLQIAYNTFAADLLRAAEKLSGLSAHSYQVPISPQSPFGRVVAGGRAEFANWTSDKAAAVLPKATRPLVGQMLKMMKIERGIVAPLRAEGTTMGVLTISGLEVEESDVPAVEAFTAHVAISLRNARLTQQVQQELEERKLAQEVLGEQRHFIEHVTEAVPDIIYVDDLIEHVSVFLSPSIFSILGYAVEDIRSGMINWHGLIHPDDLAAVQDSTERLLQMGDNEFVSVEYRMKHVDGSWRWLYARNVVFKRAADGRVQQVLGVAQDITERRQVEEKLRQNEEKYRGIFDESIAAVYIFDDKKNFINTNQAGLDLLGYSREELLRMGIPDVDANPAVVLPAHEQLLSGGRLVNYEHKLRRKDGTIITVLNNSSPLTDSRRNIVGMLSTLLDITERKQAEEKTQRRAEQFAILNDIGSRVTVSTSVNEVLQRVAQLVQEHFHYHHVGLFLYNAERAELVLRAQAGNFKILFPLDHHVRSDQGMVGWVCRERRTLLANDVRLEPAYVNVLGNLLAMRSELSVPIQSGESFFGVIDLQSAELNAFEDNDVLLIETLAQQIVVALENARLHEWAFRELAERERHEREMDTVIRMSATLRNVGSRAELSAAVVQLLREVLGVEHVLFGVADLLTGERVVIGASGNWTLLQGQRFATSFARQIAPDGTPHLVKDEDRAKFAHPELLEGLAGVVVTQLLINEEQLGSLWIGSARPISEETLQLFTLLAGLVANVMQRVNSVEQTERHTRRLTALHEIDLAISYSLDLEQTLNILLNQVCNQLRVDAADVLLYNREAQVLSYAAGFGFHTAALQHSLLRIGESLAGRAALEKKIVSSVDLSQTNNFSISPLFRQENFLSYYGVPLATRGEVVGVLEIFHRSLLQPNPDWLQFLEALAAQAAIAVDNASLFTQLQSSIKSLYETQEQLIRTARLSAVGELAAGIAHQINNPLTTVISDSQVLMRLTSDDDPLHVSAKAIYQAGWRAQRVVQRLLNFARPDENQYAPSNVNETIMESLDLIGAHLGRGGVDLQLHLASDLPLISANAHQLEEIWLNLLMNARDALSEERKGRIEVTSCLSANGEALEVSISDNGRGIRESDRANIFTPFFTTKGNNRGNGLGLSVCQSIAQHHGGEITFSSAEDVGTTFVVRMPLLRASS
ncbi:MAG: PAS domain S-box protein, partial [Chloroflexi bacterium]|nr:PAS domain S-box protein [Chloroflexota bacterium]